MHGAKVTNYISLSLLLFVDLLYVYDGGQLDAAQSAKECSECVTGRFQPLVNSYVGGLEVTVGVCKPSECHWWPIGFKWKAWE